MAWRWQYQGLAEPVLFSTPEIVTLDKWFHPSELPTFSRKQFAQSFVVGSLEPSLTQLPPPLSWFFPDRTRPFTRKQLIQEGFTLEPFQVSAPISNEIDYSILDGALRVKVAWPYQGFVEPLEPSLTQAQPPLSWLPVDDPVIRARKQQEGSFTGPFQFQAPETITVDKWFQPLQIPVRPLLRPNLGFSVGPITTSFGEVVFIDKWQQPLAVPVRKIPYVIPENEYPSFVPIQNPVNLDWLRPTQTPFLPRPHPIPESFYAVFIPPIRDNVNLDWLQQTSLPCYQIKQIIDFTPTFFVVVPPLSVPCPYLPFRTEFTFEYSGRGEEVNYTPGRTEECK